MFDREIDYRVVWPIYKVRLHGPGNFFLGDGKLKEDHIPDELMDFDYLPRFGRIHKVSSASGWVNDVQIPQWITYHDVMFRSKSCWDIWAISLEVDIKGKKLYKIIDARRRTLDASDTLKITDLRFEHDR